MFDSVPQSPLLFAPAADLAISLIAGLFGLLIGSFLNVVIHRLPKMMQRESDNYCAVEAGKPEVHIERYNLMVPRSACPHCHHQITALENIPVVSYLVLRGKCSNCKAPISPRYPAIELLTGVLSALLVWKLGTGWQGLGGLFFLYSLVALTFIDADTQLLPDDLTYPLIWAGLLLNVNGTFVPLRDAVIGAAAGYLALWTIYWAYKLVRGREGMGYGDFKLLAALGAWMGWATLPAIVLMASLVGAVVGIALMVVNRRGFDYQIPFGPYLAAAGLITFLYREPLTEFTRVVYPYF
jgi:leader peptidase (prepilin peptidase)/N-methyltransferase